MAKLNPQTGELDYGDETDEWMPPNPWETEQKPGAAQGGFVGSGAPAPTPQATPNVGVPGLEAKKDLPSPAIDQTGPSGLPTKPGGGNINDPTYLNSLLDYYGKQPGVNPSVTNDPNYWRQAVGSGRFKGDEQYLIQRFMQAEGPPEGADGPSLGNDNRNGDGGGGISALLQQLISGQQGRQAGVDSARGSLRDTINRMISLYSQPVTGQDPTISGRVQSYEGQVGRGVNKARERFAERAHATGLPTGAFDSWVGDSELKAGQAIGDYEGGLIGEELTSRRAQLSDMLNKALSLGSSEDAGNIQMQIAAIDAQLRNKGLDQNYDLTKSGQDISRYGIDTNAALTRSGQGIQQQGINNQNSQFYDQYAQNDQFHNDDIDKLLSSLLLGGGSL